MSKTLNQLLADWRRAVAQVNAARAAEAADQPELLERAEEARRQAVRASQELVACRNLFLNPAVALSAALAAEGHAEAAVRAAEAREVEAWGEWVTWALNNARSPTMRAYLRHQRHVQAAAQREVAAVAAWMLHLDNLEPAARTKAIAQARAAGLPT